MGVPEQGLRSIIAALLIQRDQDTLRIDPRQWRGMREFTVTDRMGGNGEIVVEVVEAKDGWQPPMIG